MGLEEMRIRDNNESEDYRSLESININEAVENAL